MLKLRHIIGSMLAIATVIIVLGIAVNVSGAVSPKPEPPAVYKIDATRGLFSGEIVPIALNPQPEPPKIWKIGMNSGRGIFSGELPYCCNCFKWDIWDCSERALE